MKRIRYLLFPLLLCMLLVFLCGCRVKTGIQARIDAAEFVVVRVYENDTVYEVTISDEEDVDGLKEACQVLGAYQDDGYDHLFCELIFAGAESEITLWPAYEAADYIRTDGGTYYRTGMDRRIALKSILESYGVFLS